MNRPPSIGAAIGAIATVTALRVFRSATLWIGVGFAALPVVEAVLVSNYQKSHSKADDLSFLTTTIGLETVAIALVASLLVGWPVGEDIEDRTGTYLWSRPLRRWSILAGKLAILTPVVIAVFVASWGAIIGITHADPSPQPFIALAAGAVVASFAAAALALLLPKHPLVLSLVVLAVLDPIVGSMTGGVPRVTISYNTRVLAGLGGDNADMLGAAIALAVIGAIWLAIAVRRIQRIQL